MSDDLLALSAVELRRRIGAKQLSPIELLEACIARIQALNPAVNAVTATDYRAARDQALVAERAVMNGDELGRLHGLPTGIKDLYFQRNLTLGEQLFERIIAEKLGRDPIDDSFQRRIRPVGVFQSPTRGGFSGRGCRSRHRGRRLCRGCRILGRRRRGSLRLGFGR